MSILIKGVDMPKNCYECFAFKSNMFSCKAKWVIFGEEDAEWLPLTTPNWCPLVEVPRPH